MTQKPHHNACCMLTDIRKTKNHYSPLLVGLSIVFSLLCSNRKNSSGRRSPMPEESKVGYCNVGFCFVCKNRRRRRKGTKSVCLSPSLSHAPVAGVEATDPVVLVACQASLEIRTNAAHRHDSLPHDAQPRQSNHNYTLQSGDDDACSGNAGLTRAAAMRKRRRQLLLCNPTHCRYHYHYHYPRHVLCVPNILHGAPRKSDSIHLSYHHSSPTTAGVTPTVVVLSFSHSTHITQKVQPPRK